MTIKHFFTSLFILYFFISCKKDGGSNSSGSSNKLKTYVEDIQAGSARQTDSFAITYDNNNRIISVASLPVKFLYTYSDKSFTLDLYENNQLAVHEIAYLNGIPYVDSTFQYNNTNDTTTEKYIYAGNLLTSETSYDYSNGGSVIDTRDDYTYDNNGNVIKDVETDGQGNVLLISTYTYTNKPLNVSINPIYFAPGSKYLPATRHDTDGAGNPYTGVAYSYTFDNSGRLIKETDLLDNGDIDTKTSIYE